MIEQYFRRISINPFNAWIILLCVQTDSIFNSFTLLVSVLLLTTLLLAVPMVPSVPASSNSGPGAVEAMIMTMMTIAMTTETIRTTGLLARLQRRTHRPLLLPS